MQCRCLCLAIECTYFMKLDNLNALSECYYGFVVAFNTYLTKFTLISEENVTNKVTKYTFTVKHISINFLMNSTNFKSLVLIKL